MRYRRYITGMPASMILWGAILMCGGASAHALDRRSIDNLQAAMRTLNFLESLPKTGTIVIGVVYPSDLPVARGLAEQTAKAIGEMHGPNSRTLQSLVLSTNELARLEGHLDVLFLVAGASKHAETILEAVRNHRLVSISDDPVCVDAKCCVLMVRADQRVEISLNTALANAVGARFSLVFTMVVKRR